MPAVNPYDWFLNYDPATHDGNLVTPLIDGEAMMGAIYEHIIALDEEDFCFFGAWAMNPGQFLTTLARDSGQEDQKLFWLFQAALGRHAEIRLLLYQGMPEAADYYDILGLQITHSEAQKKWLDLGSYGAEAIIDTKHPSFGSQHQKYAVFGKRQTSGGYILTAFCGGIDLGNDRFDNSEHIPSSIIPDGWHDVHAKIQGPAAEQILDDFISRWDEHSYSASALKSFTTRFDKSRYAFELPPQPPPFSHQVEVLKTYARRTSDGSYYEFAEAEGGIRTVEEAYLKAINLAQHYIYIEQLYFYHYPIVEALAAQLAATPQLKLIVVLNYLGKSRNFADRYHENRILDVLTSSAGADQLYVCDLRHPDAGYKHITEPLVLGDDEEYTKPIYVHSKLMIVDDVYVTLGSANLDPRGMTHDSEVNIGVLDTDQLQYSEADQDFTVCRFARDFRMSLWNEHLNLEDDSPLLTIPTALDTWILKTNYGSRDGYESKAPSRVFNHDPAQMGAGIPSVIFWTIAHPTL